MKKIIILFAVLAIGAFIFYFASSNSNTNPFSPKNQDDQVREENTAILGSQINNEGGLSIEVHSEVFDFNNPQFKVVLNTHQGNLDFDLAKISILTDDRENEYLPLKWEGGKGGHHLSGNLIFPMINKEAKTIKLVIKNAYGIAEREFFWEIDKI